MKGWTTKTIGDLCDGAGGKVQTGPFGSQLHESDYSETGIPFVMPQDIIGGRIDETRIARVSEPHVDRLRRHKLAKGDIIYGRRGDIGRQALIRDENVGWLCGSGCIKITLGKSIVLPEFVHRYLQIPEIISWIEGQAIGATMANLNTNILRRVPVSYPTKMASQRKIAAILSAYDELIENNKRRIALLEKMAEEIYREWFVRLRFPGHEKVKVIKGVPQGWKLVKIENAFKFTGGGTPSKEVTRYWKDGEVNWFTPSDITSAEGIFLQRSNDQCTEEGVSRSSARMFPAYSVMVTSRATIGAIGINLTPACTNQGFITCIPNSRYPLPFLYHWLKLSKPHFEILAVGATFAELTKGVFKRIEILTPSEPIVTQFAQIESPLFKAIEIHFRENTKLIETRNKLLPRLISGKLSVENLDIQFPPSMVEELNTESTATAHA
jgi:type I restriction enzyme S subunit